MLHLMERGLLEERIRQLDSLVNVLAQAQATQIKDVSLLKQLPKKVNNEAWWVYDQNFNLIDSQVMRSAFPLSSSRRQVVKLTGKSQQKINFPTQLDFFDDSKPEAHFIVPITSDHHLTGLLELQFSLADIRLQLWKTQQILFAYILLYVSVLVFAGYHLLQRNIIKPARNLLRATENVRYGNLEFRLPIAGPTEISQLAIAYNQMIDSLRVSRGETDTHIASLEKTNEKLQQARDALIRSEKMASVGQLAAGLAHELGNPLAALIGYLELLTSSIESTSDLDIVERSLVETNRIDFLVRELLDFSRPAESFQPEPVEMVSVLRSSIQLLKNQGVTADIKFLDELPAALVPIKIDRNKLQQVFINLLLNAIQSFEHDGVITLFAGEDEVRLWLGIKDDGSGIAAVDLNKIFEPFYTTKAPGDGTGLGLTICQRIIEESRGTINVKSVPESGSTFELSFQKKDVF